MDVDPAVAELFATLDVNHRGSIGAGPRRDAVMLILTILSIS